MSTAEVKKSKTTSLKFYKLNEQAQLPVFATKQSACFDLYANLIVNETVQYYGAIQTKELPRRVSFDINSNRPYLQINNMERMLIPTGLIADFQKVFQYDYIQGLVWHSNREFISQIVKVLSIVIMSIPSLQWLRILVTYP